MSAERPLDERERRVIAAARDKAHVLYEGVRTPHRSCGIALAETFGVPTRPYQALRRGGITGEGVCGAVRAGELILGERLGDPDPTGPVTDRLRAAIQWYQRAVAERLATGGAPDLVCNTLTRPHGDFAGPARVQFCTHLAAQVAEFVAEALVRFGDEPVDIEPLALAGGDEDGSP
ncbi:MAG: hypothetical protein D6689_02595 [Deltaproteobacteria bacterium]|nr:MAG: hypothetical protein D6689_02595 [Deltaproteobacteria bacterium]